MALLNMLRRAIASVPTPDDGRSVVFMDETTKRPMVKHDDGTVSDLRGVQGEVGPQGPLNPDAVTRSGTQDITGTKTFAPGALLMGPSGAEPYSDENPPQTLLVEDLNAVPPVPPAGLGVLYQGPDGLYSHMDDAGAISKMLSAAQAARISGIALNVVTDFGADPTGATDCTAAFQAAANGVGAGGEIHVPAGRYLIGTVVGVTIPSSHVRFKGEGRSDSIIVTPNPNVILFDYSPGSWHTGFEGIGFDNTGMGVTRAAGSWVIRMNESAPYAYVKDCDFQFHRDNILNGSHLSIIEGCNIREFAQFGGIGILLVGSPSANDKFISDITMASSKPYAAGSACIRVKQCASLRLSNLNLVGSENVLDLFPDTGQVIPSIYAINSFFDQGAVANLRVRGAGTVLRSKFTQCWFSGFGDGSTQYGAWLDGTNVEGLDFVGCDFYGNLVGIQATPNGANTCDWQVISSRISGNSTVAVRVSAGTGHRFSIISNRMGQSGGFPANGKGIEIGAGEYRSYQIGDNRGLDNNTIPGLDDMGFTTLPYNKNIRDNLGSLIQGGISSKVADQTVPVAETVVVQARIPANAVAPGTVFRIRAYGSVAATTGNPTWRVKVGANGTTADVLVSSVTGTGAANAVMQVEFMVTIRTIGSAGTVIGNGHGTITATTSQSAVVAQQTLNTTNPFFVTLTLAMSASTGIVRQAQIEAVKA